MRSLWYGNEFKLGVLGAGQLGRMLIQEAINWNVHVYTMDSDPDSPCSKISHQFTCGSITNYEDVLEFGKDKNLITVEIENVNLEALEELERNGVEVFPQPRVLRIIRDKGIQKQFYSENNIPTADFRLIDKKEIFSNVDFLPFAQKLRTGGYDGKGVQIMRSESDFEKSFDAPSVLEKFVDFEKELAVIVARNKKGQVTSYPTVECEFNPDANLVEFLFSPAEISHKIEEDARKMAIEIIEKLDMVGILAVEFFLTKEGDLLVNEIAPRPHNSGHHTIECNVTSQFEQHLRSILNLPLGATDLIQPGAMINILGEPNSSGSVFYDGLEKLLNESGVHVHIYGKETVKEFRKMGHFTITGLNLSEVKQKALRLKGNLKAKSVS
ncbi:MAG: 5-(carboxyamino)imidazole ribonucleotide synthase [Bacteroidetes bacterium]|nr:5-(carboxyamino)imidazole ribonucleotide synthase [Bacteroidota bacterium]